MLSVLLSITGDTEVDFEPFSDRTLFRILNLCASSKRRNVAGLDGPMKAGNDVFFLTL